MFNSDGGPKRWLIPLAFGCVYFFWGSTFVAVRYGVRFITPAFISGLRSVAAALILLAILRLSGQSVRVPRAEWPRTALLGLLLVTGNNLLLGFAELYVTAGYAALMTASVPILIAVAERFLPGGRPLSRMGWAGTALGIFGLLLLLEPALRAGLSDSSAGDAAARSNHAVAVGSGILAFGIASWVTGSLVSSRTRSSISPFLASAMQLLIGGTVNIGIGTAIGGWHTAHWTTGVMGALTWLAIGGSLIGFSSYTYLLHNVSVAKAATYAYVNPAVAVVLSALLLHEALHGSQWIAMAIILVAVAIVTASKSATRHVTDPELQPAD